MKMRKIQEEFFVMSVVDSDNKTVLANILIKKVPDITVKDMSYNVKKDLFEAKKDIDGWQLSDILENIRYDWIELEKDIAVV